MERRARVSISVALVAAFSLFGFLAPSRADGKVHVSFAFVNPTTGAPVGANFELRMFQVNRNDNITARTDANGVAAFDIAPVDYVLTGNCSGCASDFSPNFNFTIQYLVKPQPDGTVKVLSSTDEPVVQDSAGNYKITYVAHRQIMPAGAKDQWTKLTNLPNFNGASAEHMYLMTDGEVLVQTRGGRGFETWWLYKPDKNGSYVTGSWKQVAQPPAGYNPQNMNGAVLHSGRFMIVGGEQNIDATGKMEENTNQSYIYDLVADTWTYVAPPNNGAGDWATIGAAPFVELANGQIMVGRNGDQNHAGLPAMLYNEKDSSWTLTGTNKTTSNNEEGYTLLPNDKVLSLWNGDNDPGMLGMAETYDPATGLWTQVARSPVALGHGEIGPAIALPNGKILSMGATGKNSLYDPIANTWSNVPDFPKLSNGLQEAAADNEAAILPNGNALVVTSVFTCSTNNCYWMGPAHWYEYDVSSNTWIGVSDHPGRSAASSIANDIQVLPLPSGQVMVSTSGSVMLYTTAQGSSDSSLAPVIDNLSSATLKPGSTYTVSGKQLAGLTQGAFWGDEQQNATNYGLVQITNNATHHVSYGRAFNYSSTSIGKNAPSSFDFEIGKDVESGDSTLRVIATGYESAPQKVTISGGVDQPAAKPVASPTPTPTLTPTSSTSTATSTTTTPTTATANSPSATAANVAAKKTTITCVKGMKSTKVSSANPKCPPGYKKK